MFVELCAPSRACDREEVVSDSWRTMQEREETMSEASWIAMTKGKGKETWRLEPEGEAERQEATVPWNVAEGFSVNPQGEGRHEQVRAKIRRKEREKIEQTWKRRHLVTKVRRFRVREEK